MLDDREVTDLQGELRYINFEATLTGGEVRYRNSQYTIQSPSGGSLETREAVLKAQ